jgi:hypothetical protein
MNEPLEDAGRQKVSGCSGCWLDLAFESSPRGRCVTLYRAGGRVRPLSNMHWPAHRWCYPYKGSGTFVTVFWRSVTIQHSVVDVAKLEVRGKISLLPPRRRSIM